MEYLITPQRAEDIIRVTQQEAQLSIAEGNPPFGCVITDPMGEIVMQAHNTQNTQNDPTAHAEINALRALGAKLGTRRLGGYALFANAESCSMCASAGVKAYMDRFYFGAPSEGRMDPWITVADIAQKAANPLTIVTGILAEECAAQIAIGRQAERS